MEKKVPEIRFKGFEDEWKTTLLNEISNKVVEKNNLCIYDIVFTNSAEYGIIEQKEYFDRDIVNTNNIQGYYVVMPNDFVYNPRISALAPVGPINRNQLPYAGVMSPLYFVFRCNDKDIELSYLDYLFKSSVWHNFMFQNGNSGARSDRFSIGDNEFIKLPIQHPISNQEQKKIGALLATLDKLILKLEQKLEKLRNIKQSLLSKMFTNVNGGGGTTPPIRFKGFEGEWQVRRLSDIANRHISPNHKIHHQNLLSLSYGKIKRRDITSSKGLLPATFDTYQVVDKGVIVMRFTDLQNDQRSLRVGLAMEEGIVSPAYVCITTKDNTVPSFLYQELHYYDAILKLFYQMGDGMRQTLSYSDIEDLPISTPEVMEQNSIVVLYNDLDSYANHCEEKLFKTQMMKHSLLEKMFV